MIEYLITNFVIYMAGFFVGGFAKIDVVFGVTLPRHIKDQARINQVKKDYRRIYGIIAGCILFIIIISNIYVEELRWLFDAYVFIWFVLTMYLFYIFHKKIKNIVEESK